MADEASGARAEILRTRDFIGWAVTDSVGGRVGTVSDLLIDRHGKVRYLAVDLGLFRKLVLLPVEALEWGEGALVAPRWTAAEVKALPAYDPDIPLGQDVLAELARAHPRYYRPGPPPPPIPGDAPRIVPLREAKEFKLARGAPNLRGWTVYGSDNERAGAVTEMLVDPVALKIRYLDVDLEDDLFRLKDDRHVLVPIESVDLRERGEDVWLKGLTAAELALLPAYTGGAVDPLVEEEVRRAFHATAEPYSIVARDETSAGAIGAPPADAPALGPGPAYDDAAPPPAVPDEPGPPPLDRPIDEPVHEPIDDPIDARGGADYPPADSPAGPPPPDDPLAGRSPLGPDVGAGRTEPPPIIVDEGAGPPPLPPEDRSRGG